MPGECVYKLVLLRHGESEWNKANKFTGWTDVGLSEVGVEEAHAAAEMLKEANLDEFDVVCTSLLARAIRTANVVLSDLGLDWLPVVRSWRLNERHYGALQGLDKKETAQKHGSEQVFVWRRSYDIPPPALELDDERHPAKDARYAQMAPEQIPATECLKDVVERMLPFYYDNIVPLLRSGKRVLIAAHGNSLRALVKHLDNVSDEEIPSLNIPTAVPLVYELDENLQAIRHYYLGDAEEAAKKALAVANQAK
ncbi:MAG: hypothetical protein MHM6MM_007222 [Cercozoa sp. M6MM]